MASSSVDWRYWGAGFVVFALQLATVLGGCVAWAWFDIAVFGR